MKNLENDNHEENISNIKNNFKQLYRIINFEQLEFTLNNPLINMDQLISLLIKKKLPNNKISNDIERKSLLEINELLNKINYKYELCKRQILKNHLQN